MKKIKIAYLILAHGNFVHLQRLVDALQYEGCSFYIHVDKKVKLPVIKGDNIHFIRDRIKVYWTGFSEVKATLKLLEKAFASAYHDRYILISGADYPVRPNEAIQKKLNSEYEYISIYDWPYEPIANHHRSYFKYYYLDCFDRRTPGRKKNFYVWIEKTMRKLKLRKKIPFTLYVGWQWFALTHNCVESVLNEIKMNKTYIRFFRSCKQTSESFIHTIIGNIGSYNDKILPYLTYVKFGPHGTDIIDETHLQEIQEGDYLFARKFEDKSINILNIIDEEIRRSGAPVSSVIS